VDSYVHYIYPLDVYEHAFHFTRCSLEHFLKRRDFKIIDVWSSTFDEYTPRDTSISSQIIEEMKEYNVDCEVNILSKLIGNINNSA
jgi:hypothetical protein